MPAHSFGPEWINPLLRGDKRGTTRPQHTRVKVGDIVSIYNQQRRRIIDKSILQLTGIGTTTMADRVQDPVYNYPAECPVMSIRSPPYDLPYYYAHFLGKVEITEVYDIHPCEMSGVELNEWAVDDGFHGFHPWSSISSNGIQQDIGANMWFLDRYGDGWMLRTWTVERWDGWLERYFEPEAI